jgi:hypothetical protein
MVHHQNNIDDDLPTFYQQIPPPRGGGIIISVHVTLSYADTDYYHSPLPRYSRPPRDSTFKADKNHKSCRLSHIRQYKDNSTKNRSALLPDKVHKLICIQAAATLREHQLNGFKYEAAKWTIDDEVCKLSKQVEMSRDNIIVKFLNYQEDWEEDKIRTKNRAHESLLNDKYQHVYLYDSDTQETRRILHVEWSTAHRPAKYAVVTQFVHGIHENEEDDLVSYYINESLFDCIRAAPLPYNQQRRLIERPN